MVLNAEPFTEVLLSVCVQGRGTAERGRALQAALHTPMNATAIDTSVYWKHCNLQFGIIWVLDWR